MGLPQRVAVVGNSGSGKSTLARKQVDVYREQYRAAMADPANAHLDRVHVTSTRQLSEWFDTLG